MRRGFTLVELAIVLVIIGFLIAMGIKGTELIKSAQMQKEAQKFKKIAAAIGTYYNKRGMLPYDGRASKISQEAGRPIYTPRDGVIQFWESGGARYSLKFDGLLDDEDLRIIETPWFFSSAGYVRTDKSDGGDWWRTLYYFDPGTVWNGGDVADSIDFGAGPFTAVVLANYENKRIQVKEDSREEESEDDQCDDDCSDGLCDLNGDGDCSDTFTYYQPSYVRSGPADAKVAELDTKVDGRTCWHCDTLRTALRYDAKNEKYYQLNSELSDSDGDKRPEDNGKLGYDWNSRNRNFIAYKIW
ncbi:MAG: hypothetical protein C6I00_02890 [Nitratiruptor sp.]|nr:hypothetical protein [Nitratiruptor sp.]NPA82896.1 type II secretion system protein [Campylobacterota bacterium]